MWQTYRSLLYTKESIDFENSTLYIRKVCIFSCIFFFLNNTREQNFWWFIRGLFLFRNIFLV
jgi:hypothetical protein